MNYLQISIHIFYFILKSQSIILNTLNLFIQLSLRFFQLLIL